MNLYLLTIYGVNIVNFTLKHDFYSQTVGNEYLLSKMNCSYNLKCFSALHHPEMFHKTNQTINQAVSSKLAYKIEGAHSFGPCIQNSLDN